MKDWNSTHRSRRHRGYSANSFKITGREILLSVPMVIILILVGLWISGVIESHIDDKNAEYYSAVQITDPDMFEFNMHTNVGNAFVYGDLRAVDTVSYPDIPGEYMSLRKVTEKYTMHTRVVTTTDSKGRSHSHTEVYYSWDYAGEEEKHSEKLDFMGIQFDFSKFSMPSQDYIDTVYDSRTVRQNYYGNTTEYTGTVYTELRNGTISDSSKFYESMSIDEAIKHCTSNAWIYVFWVFWIIFVSAAVIGFYAIDNKWLE